MRRLVRALGVVAAVAAFLVSGCTTVVEGTSHPFGWQQAGPVEPVTGHPRLFVREADVERLRSWASADNPLYAQGLAVLAARAKADVDEGRVARGRRARSSTRGTRRSCTPSCSRSCRSSSPTRPSGATTASGLATLLMYVIGKAEPGVGAEEDAFRGPRFADLQPVPVARRGLRPDRRLGVPVLLRRGQGARSARCSCAGRRSSSRPIPPRSRAAGPPTSHAQAIPHDPALLEDRGQVRWVDQQLLHRARSQPDPDGAGARPWRRPGRGAAELPARLHRPVALP